MVNQYLKKQYVFIIFISFAILLLSFIRHIFLNMSQRMCYVWRIDLDQF